MAATVVIKQWTGSGPTVTTITNLRYKTADDSSGTDTTYPLVKPSSGTNYSYVATVVPYASVAPTGTINNVKYYSDGSNTYGTGVTLKGIALAQGSYTQATGTQGTSGDLSAAVYTSGTDVFTYSTGSPLSVTGSLVSTTGSGTFQLVQTQMALSTSVSAGTLTAETFTFRYDET